MINNINIFDYEDIQLIPNKCIVKVGVSVQQK